ncbi:MAG: hypothetical protein NTZ33_01985 [Bacteroidetes bacterium]|nr:hypothetical protein [Bacteroidota bacterium]
MKRYFTLYILFLFSVFSYGQDTIKHKSQILFKIGYYYKDYIGSKNIGTSDYNASSSYIYFLEHQYDNFDKRSTNGPSIGLVYNCYVNKNLNLNTGLILFFRKDKYEINQDDAIKKGASAFPTISNVISYDYQFNNIEIPLLLGYSINKLNITAGANISVFTFYTARYTYMYGNYYPGLKYMITERTIKSNEIMFHIYPSLQVNYEMNIKHLRFYPYLSFDLGAKYGIYFQGGIMISLYKHKK